MAQLCPPLTSPLQATLLLHTFFNSAITNVFLPSALAIVDIFIECDLMHLVVLPVLKFSELSASFRQLRRHWLSGARTWPSFIHVALRGSSLVYHFFFSLARTSPSKFWTASCVFLVLFLFLISLSGVRIALLYMLPHLHDSRPLSLSCCLHLHLLPLSTHYSVYSCGILHCRALVKILQSFDVYDLPAKLFCS